MRTNRQMATAHGVVGGLLAGAIVAAWFLVADLIAGDPLATPARLGAALFDRPVGNLASLVPLYTLLHFGMFALLGAVTAWVLAVTETPPRVLLGVFFGVCVLDGIHYIGLLLTSQRLLLVLPWQSVVGANAVAGVALMYYLHQVDEGGRAFGLGTLRHHPLVAEGLRIGLVGAVALAVWFFLIDVVSGAPLRTPAALGSAVFLGAAGISEVSVSAPTVLGYTLLHLMAFAGAGIGLAAVARRVEAVPTLAYIVLLAAILIESVTLSVLVAFGGWVLGALSIPAVGVGNVIAVAAMGWWIWRSRPALREGVAREGLAASP